MKYKILLVAFLLTANLTWAQKVSDIAFVRQGREVTLTYSLDKTADIRIAVSVDQGRTFGDWIENFSGDAGRNVSAGKQKTVLFYDLPELREVPYVYDSVDSLCWNDTLIRFLVEVDDGSVDIKVNNLRIRMMPVAGGTFTMGCSRPSDLKHTYETDKPVHKVTVDSFYMGRYEVTQRLWTEVMGSNPSRWQSSDRLPVEQVSYADVQIFIARLSQMTGYRFRLPTEAEWEYAARGGNKSKGCIYPGTNGDLGSVAWYGMNSGNVTHPVGTKKPNELGLYDMAGNVWEWCSDWYSEYTSDSQDNPRGPKHGENRILRGGCLNSPSWGCAVSDRSWYLPDHGYGFHGFRLVLDSVEEPDPDEEDY